ncbi:TPA: hypothetical protein PX772_002849 [Vibrio cholerae]|nr:hypothetical protein [Vibrio cholerae]
MTENQTLKGSVDPLPTITLYASGVPVEIACRMISKSKQSTNYGLYGYKLRDLLNNPIINKHRRNKFSGLLSDDDPILRVSSIFFTLCPVFLQTLTQRLQQSPDPINAYRPTGSSCLGNVSHPEISQRASKVRKAKQNSPQFIYNVKVDIGGNTYILDRFESSKYNKIVHGKTGELKRIAEQLFLAWLELQPTHRKVSVNHYNEPVKLATVQDFTQTITTGST